MAVNVSAPGYFEADAIEDLTAVVTHNGSLAKIGPAQSQSLCIKENGGWFPLGSHGHSQSDVAGLVASMSAKSDVGHTHPITDTVGLTAALGLKADLVGGVIPTSQLPAIAISEHLGAVASEAAMLLLSGQRGDWCIRSDTNTTWILSGDNPLLIGNWTQVASPAGAVQSVNGQTGIVVLSAANVGAAAASHASAHQPGGSDAMAVDAAAGTGSLRTIGTGAVQACAGNDARLSDARTPTSHNHAASEITSGQFAMARLASGTPDGTKFVRDDGTLATPAGGGGGLTVAVKTTDQANSTTTGADITGLTVSLAANEAIHFHAFLICSAAAATTGIQLAVNGPAGSTVDVTIVGWTSTSAFATTGITALESYQSNTASAGTARRVFEVKGRLKSGATPGTFALRLRSEVAASAVNCHTGSRLEYVKGSN